ncbi:NAD(+) synthase [Erysipelotrichaceae bacterium OH741_COT-311]|nr:NAD(+) synthase [Erysipelotrichaceae bacterium OH741_COT-311]
MEYLRDWKQEILDRAAWIAQYVSNAKANGVGLGLSGGKDSVIVSFLCHEAKVPILGCALPIGNAKEDEEIAKYYADMFQIEFYNLNLQKPFEALMKCMEETAIQVEGLSMANIKPRLRMTTMYALCQARNYLVIGTGNLSEYTTGYFTKWGDGAYDFNPIRDLTVRELNDLMKYIDEHYDYDFKTIRARVPSGGLYIGQTDEEELGISYEKIDEYILGTPDLETKEYLDRLYQRTNHKRTLPPVYKK